MNFEPFNGGCGITVDAAYEVVLSRLTLQSGVCIMQGTSQQSTFLELYGLPSLSSQLEKALLQ